MADLSNSSISGACVPSAGTVIDTEPVECDDPSQLAQIIAAMPADSVGRRAWNAYISQIRS
jgi:hypothetical protein